MKVDIGENIEARIEGNKLIMEVDLTRRLRPSRSGKTISVATTSGNQKIVTEHGTVAIGVNVYTPKPL